MVTKRHNASGNYSEDEKKVLLLTSHINDHEFVPFMNVDLREKFQYAITFSDKDGLLKLSPKQKVAFSHWARPDEIFSSPTMNISNEVDYHSIKQTVSRLYHSYELCLNSQVCNHFCVCNCSV